MNECKTENLIDFSDTKNTESPNNPSVAVRTETCLIKSTTFERRESFDNNPFDCVQKLANRLDDPFEIVEKEACLKARKSIMPTAEVKLGKLLSLSDDNLLDDNKNETNASACRDINLLKFNNDSNNADCFHNENLTNVSSSYIIEENADDISNFSDSCSNSAKIKNTTDQRKRLLKLSLSNSSFNSPISRREAQQQDGTLFQDENVASPLSMLFTKAAKSGENMLVTESPLKLVEDDLMCEEPPSFTAIDKDFDADLEMLKIPILNQLPSPVIETDACCTKDTAKEVKGVLNEALTSKLCMQSDLEAIRAKLKTKRVETSAEQNVTSLIQNLKSLISNNNSVDEDKRSQANTLLETLSTALAPNALKLDVSNKNEKSHVNLMPPHTIVRQGTFDIELQETAEKSNYESSSCSSTETYELPNKMVDSMPIQQIPDIMINSSGTYDGETADEKRDLILPEVDPLYPSMLSPCLQPDVNDLIEQLSKVLEQHHLTHADESNNSNEGSTVTSSINPTFIVVMNTSQMANVTPLTTNALDHSPGSLKTRRRSQSLSIHDKIKFLQIPIPTPVQTIDQQISPPISNEMETTDFKTPARTRMRRNSFSSGTLYTPINSSVAAKRVNGISETITKNAKSRRSTALETHREVQQHEMVRPMPASNICTFKPDLKKKSKATSASNSIMKSNGPLKATMPIKKVAPMMNCSPPTAGNGKANLNSSMQLLTKSAKMSYTSTPMPIVQSNNIFPSACSTPATHTSPRYIGKSRYSYLPTTPTTKPTAPSAAAAGLKRRTLSELKTIKSPMKQRSPIKSRFSGAVPTSDALKNITKPTAKITAPSTVNRSTTRLNTRLSTYGSSLHKNKENKKP